MKTPKPTISEKRLLTAITSTLSQYIIETDPHRLFNGLLDTLLELTGSEYGFIGEVFYSEDQQPYIKSYATSNIAWNEDTQRLYLATQKKGMDFKRLDSLYGAVLTTGQPIISNQPASDSRSCGLPQGHPPLNAFMGIPFYAAGEMLGVVGVANRELGYPQSLVKSLKPFLDTCGNLIQAYRSNHTKQRLEQKLARVQEQATTTDSPIELGHGYLFTASPPNLSKQGQPVLLTRKEMDLLTLLASNLNQVVHASTIEDKIWGGVIVSESSLRSLVRRLRGKLPEISIQTVRGFGFMLVVSK